MAEFFLFNEVCYFSRDLYTRIYVKSWLDHFWKKKCRHINSQHKAPKSVIYCNLPLVISGSQRRNLELCPELFIFPYVSKAIQILFFLITINRYWQCDWRAYFSKCILYKWTNVEICTKKVIINLTHVDLIYSCHILCTHVCNKICTLTDNKYANEHYLIQSVKMFSPGRGAYIAVRLLERSGENKGTHCMSV